jgi:hypothetical protein
MEDAFFNRPCPEPIMTDEQIESLREGLDAWEDFRRKQAIKELFKRESISLELMDYGFFMRIFLWIKTLICLTIKRKNSEYGVCILAYDECGGGESGGSSWEAVWISPKIFSEWSVYVGSDGT